MVGTSRGRILVAAAAAAAAAVAAMSLVSRTGRGGGGRGGGGIRLEAMRELLPCCSGLLGFSVAGGGKAHLLRVEGSSRVSLTSLDSTLRVCRHRHRSTGPCSLSRRSQLLDCARCGGGFREIKVAVHEAAAAAPVLTCCRLRCLCPHRRRHSRIPAWACPTLPVSLMLDQSQTDRK